MHIVALAEDTDHVCARYRLQAFRPALAAAGHRLEVRALPRSAWARLWLGNDLRHADAVLLQRRLLPSWQLFLLRRRVRQLWFDLDDAVWLRDSYSCRGLDCHRRVARFAATVRACHTVIAGNAFLRASALRWCDSDNIAVVPTCVDPSKYPLAHHERAGLGVQLVWIGSSSTLQGLEAVTPLWEAIGQAVPGLRLKLVCNRFLGLRHLPVIGVQWSEADEPAQLADADIGIAHVPDDAWSRGKCGLKVLQYMAAGLPVVANPVGVHAEIIRHGETGFLADTPEQWIAAIDRLSRDPELRQRMGNAGRARLEAHYGVGVGAQLWLDLLARRQDRSAA